MPSQQTAIHRKGFYQLLKIMGTGLFICALAGYAAWAYAQERHDLPPFDQEKAKALSPEKRAEYDRLLFNELPDWLLRTTNTSSEDVLKQLAANGHASSYWLLKAWSPTEGLFNVYPSLEQLDQLATRGDTGAMCTYYWLATYSAKDELKDKAFGYLQTAAKQGQPECQRLLGRKKLARLDNRRNLPLATEQEIYDLFAASANKGYRGSFDLSQLFFYRNLSKIGNAERAYCWSTVYSDRFLANAPRLKREDDYVLRTIRSLNQHSNRAQEFQRLADRLENTHPTIQQCMELGLQ